MSNSLIIMSERRCKFCGVLLDETNQYYEGIRKNQKDWFVRNVDLEKSLCSEGGNKVLDIG